MRTILVDAHVSSMKTSLSGSRALWPLNHSFRFLGRPAAPAWQSVRSFLSVIFREQRKEAGLTQAQLAKRLRRYQSFVATVESGQPRIKVVEFLDSAEATGFDPIDAI